MVKPDNDAIIRALQKSENRFRQVVEYAPNAMIMINAQGLIELFNLQAERLFGYTRDEIVGKSIEILVPDHARADHPAQRAKFFAQPQSRPMGEGRDLYALHKDHHEFPVEIGLNPLESDDGTKILASVIDLTERVTREAKLKAALKEKDIYFSEMHHRVKNNLQVIDSILDLQSFNINDDYVLGLIMDCRNRIKSMAIIHRHLSFSKNITHIYFGNILLSLVETLFASYGVIHDRIKLDVDMANVPISMNVAIPCGLFINEVISNALKHAFPDNRDGTVTVRLAKEDDSFALLTVSDDGIGLPPTVDVTNPHTLGMQLIGAFAEQLNGDLKVNRAHPTAFTIKIALET